MQPICPSGEERGETVQTEGHGSGAGAAAGEPRPMPFARSHAKGLVLMVDGASAPNEKRSASRLRLADDAQGIDAGWRRLTCQAPFTRTRSERVSN